MRAARADESGDCGIRVNDQIVWVNPSGQTVTTVGTIQSESQDEVTIKSSFGQFPIKRSAIQKILPRRPAAAVYKEKSQKLQNARAASERGPLHLEIGLWCLTPCLELSGEPPMADRAFAHLYKAVQIDPRLTLAYPHLLDRLAQMREAKGGRISEDELEREVDIYMLAAAGGFESPEIDFRLAEIYQTRLGRIDEAVRLFEKVHRGKSPEGAGGAGPENSSLKRAARRKLAAIYRERGETEKALGLFQPGDPPPGGEAGADKDPASFEPWYEAARLLASRGAASDRARARELFQKAQALQPDLPEIGRHLSALDYADGKLRPAEIRLARLLQEGQRDAGLVVDLALVLIAEGKFQKALRFLNGLLGDAPAPPEKPAAPAAAQAGTAALARPGPGDPTQKTVAPGQEKEGEPPAGAPSGKEPSEPPAEPGSGSPAPAAGQPEAASEESQLVLPEGGSASPAEAARGHDARGLLFDYRGDLARAVLDYRKAAALDPSSPTTALLLAAGQLRSSDAAGARTVLAALIKDHADRRPLFAAYAREMSDVEMAEGQPEKAVSLLEYAVQIDPQDPLLRRKIGTLLLGLGDLDRAYSHLEAAQKLFAPAQDPALLNAMGAYLYRRGEFEEAGKLFQKVKMLVPRPVAAEGKPAPKVPRERLYAEMAAQHADDARKLEVWLDDFGREAGEEVARNWREVEPFGVSISMKDGQVVFQGQQANDPSGVTLLVREEPAEHVERLSVRLRFDAGSGPVRAGIRIESVEARGGPPTAGLVFFRDHDGTLRYAKKTTRGGWEDAQPTPDQDPQKGKPVYAGNIKWPAGTDFHTLLIRKGSTSQASSTFDLLLDGQPVAQNVVVEGLRGKTFQVGVSGQVEALGTAYRFEADDFRLYRQKLFEERSRQR